MQVLERHLFEIHLPIQIQDIRWWLVGACELADDIIRASSKCHFSKFISSFQKISTHSELPSLHFLFEPFLILGAPHSHSLFAISVALLHCRRITG